MSLTPSVLLKPPAPAPHGKEPPGPPPDTPFATVLDDHQARTAVAEGQQGGDTPPAAVADRGGHERAQRDGDRHDDRTPDAKQDGRSTGALAALLGGLPLPTAVASTVVARPPAASQPGASIGPSSPPAAPFPLTPGAPQAAPGQMPTGPAVPAPATALPLAADAKAAAATPLPSAQTAAPGAAAPAGAQPDEPVASAPPPLPSALTAFARALHAPAAASAPAAAPTTSASPEPAAVSSAAARAAPGAPASGRAAPQAVAPTVAPAPASAATPTPAAQAADPAGAADSARGVGLEHAVETVRLALRAAADRGVTQARISLNPRELGSIEIHLRQTPDGLVARVVAQHAAAAQLLQDNGADLRRQLEQSGLNVLQLDIGASNDDARRSGARAFGSPSGRSSAPDADDPLAPSAGAAETTATATLALPNGALVDVLA